MVRAVRGAITAKSNSQGEILNATMQLLQKMISQNNIEFDDIISIIFTMTKDLNAAFPAKAARKLGLKYISLLDAVEIEVPNSLKKCIRILMHFNTQKNNSEIKHIYLKDAKKLRIDVLEEGEL